MVKQGILLLQMGGPKSIEGIENFLFNLFNDPFIIQLPWFMKPFQKNLAAFISSRRAPKVAVNYKDIGSYSPICFETMCQARALEFDLNKELINQELETKPDLKNESNYLLKTKKHLEHKKEFINCYFAMRYSAPFLKDIIPVMERDGIEDLTVIPLYLNTQMLLLALVFLSVKIFLVKLNLVKTVLSNILNPGKQIITSLNLSKTELKLP